MEWTERAVWMVLMAWMVLREIVARRANREFLETVVRGVNKVRKVNQDTMAMLDRPENATASSSATTTRSPTTQPTRTTK